MSHPQVVAVAPGSPAALAGIRPGDEILSIEGEVPRDVIEYRLLVDEADPEIVVRRDGDDVAVVVAKPEGTTLGIEVSSAVFDRVKTCDNGCEFCFIRQLPRGLRESLYVKDDDFRLSFLYGNFTTLTRFRDADFARVVEERLSPLYVSIHTTDPDLRARMLRNPRGATSLRWLRPLLDNGIQIHGQIVVCPGINDGDALQATMADLFRDYPDLSTVAVVPLGVSRFNRSPSLRPHTGEEARSVVEVVTQWQERFLVGTGMRVVYPSDEYYLLADLAFPPAETYEDFAMHEDGVGMARTFEAEFAGLSDGQTGPRAGFFNWVDGAPPEGYRASRAHSRLGACSNGSHHDRGDVAIITAEYGARVLAPLIAGLGRSDIRLVPVTNRFFGGNVAVTGLMVGEDVASVLADQPAGHRYLLPDVCLSGGMFLDGRDPRDLPREVEIVATHGHSLRQALGLRA